MELGTSIRKYRKNMKMKQYKLCKIAKISANSLSLIETNKTVPNKRTIERISKALNIPVSFILWSSITDDDIPEEKRMAFNFMKVSMDSVLQSIQQNK